MAVYIGDVPGIGSDTPCKNCPHMIGDHDLWEPGGVFMECMVEMTETEGGKWRLWSFVSPVGHWECPCTEAEMAG